jgi:hypothetical protein
MCWPHPTVSTTMATQPTNQKKNKKKQSREQQSLTTGRFWVERFCLPTRNIIIIITIITITITTGSVVWIIIIIRRCCSQLSIIHNGLRREGTWRRVFSGF